MLSHAEFDINRVCAIKGDSLIQAMLELSETDEALFNTIWEHGEVMRDQAVSLSAPCVTTTKFGDLYLVAKYEDEEDDKAPDDPDELNVERCFDVMDNVQFRRLPADLMNRAKFQEIFDKHASDRIQQLLAKKITKNKVNIRIDYIVNKMQWDLELPTLDTPCAQVCIEETVQVPSKRTENDESSSSSSSSDSNSEEWTRRFACIDKAPTIKAYMLFCATSTNGQPLTSERIVACMKARDAILPLLKAFIEENDSGAEPKSKKSTAAAAATATASSKSTSKSTSSSRSGGKPQASVSISISDSGSESGSEEGEEKSAPSDDSHSKSKKSPGKASHSKSKKTAVVVVQPPPPSPQKVVKRKRTTNENGKSKTLADMVITKKPKKPAEPVDHSPLGEVLRNDALMENHTPDMKSRLAALADVHKNKQALENAAKRQNFVATFPPVK